MHFFPPSLFDYHLCYINSNCTVALEIHKKKFLHLKGLRSQYPSPFSTILAIATMYMKFPSLSPSSRISKIINQLFEFLNNGNTEPKMFSPPKVSSLQSCFVSALSTFIGAPHPPFLKSPSQTLKATKLIYMKRNSSCNSQTTNLHFNKQMFTDKKKSREGNNVNVNVFLLVDIYVQPAPSLSA